METEKHEAGSRLPTSGADAHSSSDLGKQLLRASKDGDLNKVKYLVEEKHVDPHSCRDEQHHNTPLQLASQYGHLGIVKYLVEEKNGDVMYRNKNGDIPLHSAAIGGSVNTVQYLISESGCDPMCRGWHGRTPLHWACVHGKLDVMKYLIGDLKVDSSREDEDDATPFHLAAFFGNLSAIKLLVEDYLCDPGVRTKNGETPADMARRKGHNHITSYLSSIEKTVSSTDKLPPTMNEASAPPTISDEEARTIVQKAKESGIIKQRNIVAVVTGVMGAGKTCFLKRFFKKGIPEAYTSTGVTGEAYRGILRHIANVRTLEYLPRGKILQLLAPLLKIGVPEGDVEALAQIFLDTRALTDPSSHHSPVRPPSIPVLHSETTFSQTQLRSLVRDKAESEVLPESLRLELIHMLDTGGQPEFMDAMPSLVHNTDLMILVLDLTQDLDDRPIPSLYKSGTRYEKLNVSRRTNKLIIRQLIRTMQAKRARFKGQRKTRSTKFLVVGTHKDCIPEDQLPKVLDTFNEKLEKIFDGAVKDELILYKGKRVFPLNLKTPDESDEKVLQSISESIQFPNIDEIELPLSFFMFEQDAHRYLAGRRGVEVLRVGECLEVGEKLSMSQKVVQAALLYLHEHNVFLYFPDILPNLVFLDPQVPLDFVNAIVRFSYLAEKNEIPCLTEKQQDMCRHGCITLDLLKHKELSSSFVDSVYQPEDAIKLFQKIYTIAPLSVDREPPPNSTAAKSPTTERDKEYLMMCLLPDKKEDEIHKSLSVLSKTAISPLLVRFENDCAPNGVFGNTVSCLISNFNWELLLGKPQCLAHNIVTLCAGNAPLEVTLVNTLQYFEVHVNANDAALQKHIPKIGSTVFEAITEVLRSMHFDIEFEPAFPCPCDLSVPHAATIFQYSPSSPVTNESYLMCSKTKAPREGMGWKHGVWFLDWQGQRELGMAVNYPMQAMQLDDGGSNQGYQIGNIPIHPFQHPPYTHMQPRMHPPPQPLMMTGGGSGPTGAVHGIYPAPQPLMMTGGGPPGAVHGMHPAPQPLMMTGGGPTGAVHGIYLNQQMGQGLHMWNMGGGMMLGQGGGVGRGEMGGRGRGWYGGPVMQSHHIPSSVPHPASSLLASTGGLTQPTPPYSAMEEQVSSGASNSSTLASQTSPGVVNLTMVISLEHLDKIAREYLTQWEALSPSLGLTVVEEEDIRRTHKEYADQKRAVLRRWKHNKGNGATYGAFIAAAEGISNMELADGVRDLMKELQGSGVT